MKKESFKEKLKNHQVALISKGTCFEGVSGGRKLTIKEVERPYDHILLKGSEEKNLFPSIRTRVNEYFRGNKISFWGGRTITPNTLSSQVCCLNHLFLIRYQEEAVRCVMQSFVGDKIKILSMEKVQSKTETYDCGYVAFEMISDENRMNEDKLTRGNTCTSIDALAIARDSDGKRHILVIEWKLVEDDSGNKAPTSATTRNKDEIRSGESRVEHYGALIDSSKYMKGLNGHYYDSSLFHLPFYELMRQTLWAELNMKDFQAQDYLHIHVLPKENPMRTKRYKCVGNIKGVEEGWRLHLTQEGNKRYLVADPHQVLEALSDSAYKNDYKELIDYLEERYYNIL